MKLKYMGDSHYESKYGNWSVWKEPYPPYRWYVNRKGYDETEITEGFRTKRAAVKWLEKRIAGTE